MELARSGEVKLAVLGRPPEFLPVIEGMTTLEEVLQLGRIPAGMDIRLNGALVERGSYGKVAVQPGDLLVAVPMIEGGAG